MYQRLRLQLLDIDFVLTFSDLGYALSKMLPQQNSEKYCQTEQEVKHGAPGEDN